jgi:hypothetical protein
VRRWAAQREIMAKHRHRRKVCCNASLNAEDNSSEWRIVARDATILRQGQAVIKNSFF